MVQRAYEAYLILGILLLITFQSVFASYFQLFDYFDEIFAICLFAFGIAAWMYNRSYKIAKENLWQLIVASIRSAHAFTAWDLCAKTVFFMCLLFLTWKGKKDIFYLALAIALLASTGKGKAFGAIVLIIFCFFWVICKHKRIKIKEVIIVGVLAIIAAVPKIYEHYIVGMGYGSPRVLLFKESVTGANNHFPLGSGWGTWGSHFAKEDYSPLYELFGWADKSDVGTNSYYLEDTYWPSVYAEAGWIDPENS